MSIHVQCPNAACSKNYVLPADLSGRKVRCKECRQYFTATPAPEASQVATSGESIPAETIAHFQLRGRLGAGAFGTVYRAYDPRLDRDVAVKVPHPAVLENPKRADRFFREARAAAGLRHPNIVPVYDSGVVAGRSYIASAFITGQPLDNLVEEGGIDCRRAARIVRKVAEGLAYAHAQGVVHRDIKPANILLEADDIPLIADFGLAARADDESRLTNDGAILGTPSYMAPEQAAGQQGEAKPTADQYSAGVLLYELLTGKTPFEGPPAIVLHNAIHTQPEPPSKHRKDIPRDLETICLKAMAKRPEQRYPDCQALADDLRRWLDGEPITARRPGFVERAVRWVKKEPRLAAALGAVLASLIVIGILLLVRTTQLIRELQTVEVDRDVYRARAEEEKQAAESARDERDDEKLNAASARAVMGDAVAVEQLVAEVNPERRGPDWGLVAMKARLAPEFGQILRRPGNAFGGTSGLLFTNESRLLGLSASDHTVTAWDVWTGRGKNLAKLPWLAGREAYLSHHAILSGDGKRALWVGSKGGQGPMGKEPPLTLVVHVYEVGNDKPIRSWSLEGFWPIGAIDREGKRIALSYALAGQAHRLGVWDVASGERIAELDQEIAPAPLRDVVMAFSPDGSALAATTARDKGELRAWAVPAGDEVLAVVDIGLVSKVAFSPDGQRLAAVGGTELAKRTDDVLIHEQVVAVTKEMQYDVTTHEIVKKKVRKVLKDRDGKDCEVEYEVDEYIPKTMKQKQTYTEMHQQRLTRPGPWLLPRIEVKQKAITEYVTEYKEVDVVEKQTILRTGKRKVNGKEETCSCPDTIDVRVKKLVTVCKPISKTVQVSHRPNEGILRAWDRGGKLTFRVEESVPIEAIAWRGDGLRLAAALRGTVLKTDCDAEVPGSCPLENATSTLVKLWHSRSVRLIHVLDRAGMVGVSCLAFSPAGTHLAAGFSITPAVVCWSAESKTLVAARNWQEGAIEDLVYSGDGKMLASFALCSDRVRLWDGETGNPLRHVAPTQGASLFGPGNLLLTGLPREPNQFGYFWRGPSVWKRESGEPVLWPDFKTLAASVSTEGARVLVRKEEKPGNNNVPVVEAVKKVLPAVEVRDTADDKLTTVLEGSGENLDWGLAPGGKYAAGRKWSGPGTRSLRVWRTDTGKTTLRRENAPAVAFSPDGAKLALLAITPAGCELQVVDPATGETIKTITVPGAGSYMQETLYFAGADRLVLVGRGQVEGFDLTAGKTLFIEKAPLEKIAISSDGKLLAFLAGNRRNPMMPVMAQPMPMMAPPGQQGNMMVGGRIVLHDLRVGRKLRELKVNARWVADLAFAPDGKLLAYGGHRGAKDDEGVVEVVTVEKGARLASYRGHTGSVTRLAFRPDGKILASGGAEGSVRLWRLPELDLEPLAEDPDPAPEPPMPISPAYAPTPGPVQAMPAPTVKDEPKRMPEKAPPPPPAPVPVPAPLTTPPKEVKPKI